MTETILKSGKALTIGDIKADIVPDQVPVDFVDIVLENRHHAGVVYLSLGAFIVDGANNPEIRVSNRLRMNLLTAQALRDMLKDLCDSALAPPDTSRAN